MPKKGRKRNPRGMGSYSKTANNRYRAQFPVGNGKRVSKTFDTAPQAAAWLIEQYNLREKGISYSGMKTTLREFAEDWLVVKSGAVKPGTIEQYGFLLKKYVYPKLGGVVFKDLTTGHFQRLYSDLLKEGVGRTTIERVHGVLHGLLQHALVMQVAPFNYVKACIVPRPENKEMQIWTESEMSTFILASRENKLHRLFRFALYSGMRLGELLALRWSDINWENKTFIVQRQVLHPTGGGFVFSEPKTRYSRRTLRLEDEMIGLLREQLEYVNMLRLFAGKKWKEHDLVFPSSVGTPITRWNVERAFREEIAKVDGLKRIRFHDMRHTCISHKISRGIDIVTVSREAGHASPAFTYAKYSHFIEGENQQKSARVMAELTTPVEVFFEEDD